MWDGRIGLIRGVSVLAVGGTIASVAKACSGL